MGVKRAPNAKIGHVVSTSGKQFAAVLLTGHLREMLERQNAQPVLQFLRHCRETLQQCDLFLHTWNSSEPLTGTYHRQQASPSTVDVRKLVSLLSPVQFRIEHQQLSMLLPDLPESAALHQWGNSQMSIAGIRLAFYAMRVACSMARSHGQYDLFVRARPDMYRLRQGGRVPVCVLKCCFQNVAPDELYVLDATPQGLPTNESAARRIAYVGGGDNFLWAQASVWAAVLDKLNDRFHDVSKATWVWNRNNPESMVVQASRMLGLRMRGCGGLEPWLRGPCGAACERDVLAPIHFVNYASGAMYELNQDQWAQSALSMGKVDRATVWTPEKLDARTSFRSIMQRLESLIGIQGAYYRGGQFLFKVRRN